MQHIILLLKQYEITPYNTTSLIIIFGIILITGLTIHFILHRIVLRFLEKRAEASSHLLLLNIITQNKLFQRLAFTIQGVIVNIQTLLWLKKETSVAIIVTNCAQLWVMLYALMSFFSLLDVTLVLSKRFSFAIQFPLKGLLQSIKLISSILIAIMMISLLIGKSPTILISGLGAMAAILMLVFKDPILGLVAGIQLSANNMLKLNDWLEMPKYGADGTVIDIGLTTVKVRNWDNTITTIPTYTLVSDAFKNWTGMSTSGGRRIKRCINIDTTSIRFLTDIEQQKLIQAKLLHNYLVLKKKEIDNWNLEHGDSKSILNQRCMTNIGTFRAYLIEYLHHHPCIRQDMTLMVRQLAPNNNGLPIEIYAFTNTVAWLEYEEIQANIFDYIVAILAEFDLRIYQFPTGNDVRTIAHKITQ